MAVTYILESEKIAASALRCGEQIFTGPTHFAAMHKIIGLPVSAEQKAQMMLDAVDGFVTDAGRFVTREEGYAIAKGVGQIGGDLADPVKNKAFYGGSEPRLDSGMVESMAPFKVQLSANFL